jgi:hypothetical protein
VKPYFPYLREVYLKIMGNIIFIEDEAKTKEGDEYTFVERTPTVEEYQRLHQEVGGGIGC